MNSTKVLLLLSCVVSFILSVSTEDCFVEDWSNTMNKKGESVCTTPTGSGYYFLKGLERDGTDDLRGIKRAKCCLRDQTFWNLPTICQIPDWQKSMDGTGNSWCPEGLFVRGLIRGDSHNVGSIDWGKCCKPSHHPYDWGDCYNEDVSNAFNKPGLSECTKDGYFIAGFENENGNGRLSSIKRFKCCKMWHEIPKLTTLEGVKERVMDTTMFYIGVLANMMGFAWSGGCWAYHSGEDFQREGDKWVSRYREPCLGDGPQKGNRLKITFSDFSYTMKDVVFGASNKQSFHGSENEQYLTSYSRVGRNNRDTSYSPQVEMEIRSARTLKNVKTTKWDSNFGIEVGIAKEPPSTTGGVGFSAKAGLSYTWGGGEDETIVDEDWHILKITETKELPPKSYAKWNAVKIPSKVTIPYTAKILPTFTVTLEGYMRWGGGSLGDAPNFHHEYRGSNAQKTISYTFGDANKPFYKDLKEKVQQNVYPWQWHALKQKYPLAQDYIDTLTDEDRYVFTLTGQFEEATEYEVQSTWSTSLPLDQLKDAKKKLKEKDEEPSKLPELPRIYPEPPEVDLVDNSKEIKVPSVHSYIK